MIIWFLKYISLSRSHHHSFISIFLLILKYKLSIQSKLSFNSSDISNSLKSIILSLILAYYSLSSFSLILSALNAFAFFSLHWQDSIYAVLSLRFNSKNSCYIWPGNLISLLVKLQYFYIRYHKNFTSQQDFISEYQSSN